MKDLQLLNVITQIRHAFGGKSIIWRVREGSRNTQEVWRGHARDSRSKTDGIWPISMRLERVSWIVWVLADGVRAPGPGFRSGRL